MSFHFPDGGGALSGAPAAVPEADGAGVEGGAPPPPPQASTSGKAQTARRIDAMPMTFVSPGRLSARARAQWPRAAGILHVLTPVRSIEHTSGAEREA